MPSSCRCLAICSAGTWLPFVNTASGRPEARIRSSTSTAPGWGWARPSGPRWASVPSTSNMKPRTSRSSPSSTAPHHRVAAVVGELELRDRRPAGELLDQRDQRAATGPSGGGRGRLLARLDHRVDLLAGHGQAQEQLLLGDALAESLARAVE